MIHVLQYSHILLAKNFHQRFASVDREHYRYKKLHKQNTKNYVKLLLHQQNMLVHCDTQQLNDLGTYISIYTEQKDLLFTCTW